MLVCWRGNQPPAEPLHASEGGVDACCVSQGPRRMKLGEASLSIAPDGATFPIPDNCELDKAWVLLKSRAESARAAGQRIVAVQGLGFVGAAVAAVVAGARDDSGKAPFFVVGVDLAT